VKVSALNINGRYMRGREDKWPHINRLMFDEKIGVLAVGETHLTEEQVDEIQAQSMGRNRLRVFNSTDIEHPNRGGIALVLNKDITNTENIGIRRLVPGRAILATIPWHGTLTLTALAVYAPADSPASNQAFWEELRNLWLTENLPIPDMLLGDMNIVPDALDRLPHRADDAGATSAKADLNRIFELKDGWRLTNPETKAYTYSHGIGTHSRIDRIEVSPTLFKNCRYWEISDAAGDLTDHRLISVTVCAPGAPYIGRGRYAIPLFLMNDTKFIEFAVSTGASMFEIEEDDSTGDLQTRFKNFKDRVRDFAKARAALMVGALEEKRKKLQAERKKVLERPQPETGTAEVKSARENAIEAVKLDRQIDKIVSRQRARKKMSTKVRYKVELDTITKFSVRVNKDVTPRDTISILRRTDVTPEICMKRSDKMSELARDYHNDLQYDESESDPIQKKLDIRTVLDEMGRPEMVPGMETLAEEMAEEDIVKALKASASGKAPGVDGIPTEFWAKLCEMYMAETKKRKEADDRAGEAGPTEATPLFDIILLLKRIYNDIERRGITQGTDFAKGWMCPIYKKKDVTDIANYRPITVLNTDYKIFTKALTLKL
ncbi:Endonuclease/exonuclease/phosphatase, partial [Mycena crocata]